MFKTMWMEFWNRLGTKERSMVKGIGGTVAVIAVLVIVGQMTKPKPDPLTQPYMDALQQAGKEIKAATQKPQP